MQLLIHTFIHPPYIIMNIFASRLNEYVHHTHTPLPTIHFFLCLHRTHTLSISNNRFLLTAVVIVATTTNTTITSNREC